MERKRRRAEIDVQMGLSSAELEEAIEATGL
jgi:hypothetical protein